MREPVALDGLAATGVASVGELRLRFPGILWTRTGPSPKSGDSLNSTSPLLELPAAPSGDEVELRPTEHSRPLLRAVLWQKGNENVRINFPSGSEERSRGPGHLSSIHPSVCSVSWPLASSDGNALAEKGIELCVWANAKAHLRSPESFVRSCLELREALGPAPLLWAPGVAVPCNLAFLHLLGIDFLDTTEGYRLALEGSWLYPDLEIEAEHLARGQFPGSPESCGCPGCLSRVDTPSARLAHAAAQYQREEALVRERLRLGRLRELVESRVPSNPGVGTLLRYLDEEGFPGQERVQPLVGLGTQPYATEASYHRPEMERFRRRFVLHYRPPRAKRILLLVPCSYTKPYANSPSHRAFARAVEAAGDPALVHWVSVTSPLGVVPRELENFYPARNYDIPVTGRWTEPERRWVSEALSHLQEQGSYAARIAYLPREEYAWLRGDCPEEKGWQWPLQLENATSPAGLAHLEAALRTVLTGRASFAEVRRDEARSSLGFQFCPAVAERLLDGATSLRGPHWFQSLTEPGTGVLATWKEDRGTWRLTTSGAKKALDLLDEWKVEIDPGVPLHGDLFAPGALRAGREVRPGSNVVLVRGGRLTGVGEALVPGIWVGRLTRGMVVRIRSHREEGPPPD